MPSWKVKGVDGVFNAMDGSLIDRNNWEEIMRFLKLFTLNFELQEPIWASFVSFIFLSSPRNLILMGFLESSLFSL